MANWDLSTTITTNITLHLLDRVTSITHSKVMGEDASTLSQFTYGYDANGQLISETGSKAVGDCSWEDCKVRVGGGEGNNWWLGRFKGVFRYRFGRLDSKDRWFNFIARGER